MGVPGDLAKAPGCCVICLICIDFAAVVSAVHGWPAGYPLFNESLGNCQQSPQLP